MNQFDLAGTPTTFAIIGVLTMLVLALKLFMKKFPQVAERIMDATPWMGWCTYDEQNQTTTYNPYHDYPVHNHRW